MPDQTPTVFTTYPKPPAPKGIDEGQRKYLDNYYDETFIKKLFA